MIDNILKDIDNNNDNDNNNESENFKTQRDGKIEIKYTRIYSIIIIIIINDLYNKSNIHNKMTDTYINFSYFKTISIYVNINKPKREKKIT